MAERPADTRQGVGPMQRAAAMQQSAMGAVDGAAHTRLHTRAPGRAPCRGVVAAATQPGMNHEPAKAACEATAPGCRPPALNLLGTPANIVSSSVQVQWSY